MAELHEIGVYMSHHHIHLSHHHTVVIICLTMPYNGIISSASGVLPRASVFPYHHTQRRALAQTRKRLRTQTASHPLVTHTHLYALAHDNGPRFLCPLSFVDTRVRRVVTAKDRDIQVPTSTLHERARCACAMGRGGSARARERERE